MSVLPQPTIPTEWYPPPPPRPPNHLELPETDGAIVENFLEHPETILLTEAILPVLRRRHPDGRFAIGQNSGVYYRHTDPPLDGCKAPDWFYVPDVPPDLDGHYRRSYVIWMEVKAPEILIEIVSGDGSEERDRTPNKGKFWVYEQAIRAPYYAIYDPIKGQVAVHRLVGGNYEPVPPNARGHYPIESLGVELGIWKGFFINTTQSWLRWFDAEGNLLLNNEERAERESQRAEQEKQRAEQEKQRAEQEKQRAEQEKQRAEQEKQRAEQEHHRAERLAARLRELGVDPEQPEKTDPRRM